MDYRPGATSSRAPDVSPRTHAELIALARKTPGNGSAIAFALLAIYGLLDERLPGPAPLPPLMPARFPAIPVHGFFGGEPNAGPQA